MVTMLKLIMLSVSRGKKEYNQMADLSSLSSHTHNHQGQKRQM